jgi:hypothetical protein
MSASNWRDEIGTGLVWPADMTTKQIRRCDKLLEQAAWAARQVDYLHAEITDAPSWRAEITDSDGQRCANGLRFALRDEAARYLANLVNQGEATEGEIIACAAGKSNVETAGDTIFFSDCTVFKWIPVAPRTATDAEARP